MGDSSREIAVRRELVFMCADSGAVVALIYAEGRRPVLTRAVVFLASGETVWADGGPGGGSRPGLTVRDRGMGGQYDLRLSVQGALLPGPAELADPADLPGDAPVDSAPNAVHVCVRGRGGLGETTNPFGMIFLGL